ncbi:MAG: hypothetical protein WA433_12755 [Desulfobaccales bacterium]
MGVAVGAGEGGYLNPIAADVLEHIPEDAEAGDCVEFFSAGAAAPLAARKTSKGASKHNVVLLYQWLNR